MEQAKKKLEKQSRQDSAAKGSSEGVEQDTMPGPSGLCFNVPTGVPRHECLNISMIYHMRMFLAQPGEVFAPFCRRGTSSR